MTAQVGILNKRAVVLATDSATTVFTPYRKGRSNDKVYDSANKLFPLSENYPVGIMVHSRPDICNIPWETIIKMYSKENGHKSFPTLQGYVKNFLKYLPKIIPKAQQIKSYKLLAQAFCESIEIKIRTKARENNIAESKINDLIDEEIINQFTYLKESNNSRGYNDLTFWALRNKHEKFFREIISGTTIFKNLSKKSESLMLEALALLIGKLPSANPEAIKFNYGDYSGLVIAGFGEKELLPKIDFLRVSLVFENVVKFWNFAESTGDFGIYPIAQRDVVETFMTGISPFMMEKLYIFLMNEICPLVMRANKKDPKAVDADDVDKDEIAEIMKRLRKKIGAVQRSHYEPIISLLDAMPILEMVKLAGSLVDITSIKRKFNAEDETVGGKIKIAAISKGDGFVWMNQLDILDKSY